MPCFEWNLRSAKPYLSLHDRSLLVYCQICKVMGGVIASADPDDSLIVRAGMALEKHAGHEGARVALVDPGMPTAAWEAVVDAGKWERRTLLCRKGTGAATGKSIPIAGCYVWTVLTPMRIKRMTDHGKLHDAMQVTR